MSSSEEEPLENQNNDDDNENDNGGSLTDLFLKPGTPWFIFFSKQ